MRVAVYTRYSTDDQRSSSITDQLRNCQRRIDQQGWTLAAHFSDEAISGGVTARPGYQAMLAAARGREFDVLMMDELSRAWRDQVESERAMRSLEFQGKIRIISVTDGYDSDMKARKVVRMIHAFKNEMELDHARERTHRALTGRALQRFCAGGLPYGYQSVSRTAGGEHVGFDREPHPLQAPIVQEIFARTAAGETMKAIACDLNARGVACPGAKWKREDRAANRFWRVSALHAMLSNEVYIGRYVWNRSRWERDPDSQIRKRIERPPSEWITQDIPHWRLVDDLTWQRVQKRMRERSDLFNRSQGGRARYLLSGIMRCGVCGGAYVISTHKPVRYGCSTHRSAGPVACSNALLVTRDVAETCIVEPIVDEMLSDEAIEIAVALWEQLAAADAAEPEIDAEALRRLDGQIARLEAMRDAGTLSQSVAAAALQRAYSERQALCRPPPPKPSAQADCNPVAEYRATMRGFRQTLTADDIPAARDTLREIIGAVVVIPEGGVPIAEFGPTEAVLPMFDGQLALKPAPATNPVYRVALVPKTTR